jgi:hypothetical protein
MDRTINSYDKIDIVFMSIQRTLKLQFIAIVTYDHEIEVPLELTEMTPQGKENALSSIKSITARGSTDLCGGLLKGLELAEKRTKYTHTHSLRTTQKRMQFFLFIS